MSESEEIISQFDKLGLRYEYEERAAILEYDGKLNRKDAEVQAVKEMQERVGIK